MVYKIVNFIVSLISLYRYASNIYKFYGFTYRIKVIGYMVVGFVGSPISLWWLINNIVDFMVSPISLGSLYGGYFMVYIRVVEYILV